MSNSPLAEAAEVARQWHVPPRAAPRSGWTVYTLQFVLATLQGRITEPHKVRRSAPWLVVGTVVRALMAVAQLVLMLLAWVPVISSIFETTARVFSRNSLGFFLRGCYWKARLRELGQDTIIDQHVDIWGAESVSIGSNCHIDTNVRLAAGERRHGQHGLIRIGHHVHLGPGVHIAGRGSVEIHDMVGISAGVHIYSATNTVERPSDPGQLISMSHIAPPDQQHVIESPVVIEEYAFIGMLARIMPGVRVGRGAVVHGNVELTRSVPPLANIGGVPRGRQIGWRRPRRASPKIDRSAAEALGDRIASQGADVCIREVFDPNDWPTIEAVVDLHAEAFREGVTTHLGRNFVRRYYCAMITSRTAFLWVAERQGRVCGFLGCTTDRHAFEHANRSGWVRILATWRFATGRLSVYAILRALRKHRLSRGFEDPAELLSIVVSPHARRTGLGRRFLDTWSEKLRQEALSGFLVYTDNPEGLSFYKKYGGRCLFEFRLASLESACFRFEVPAAKEGAAVSSGGSC